MLRRGGLEIYSTMDLDLQNTTDTVVKAEMPMDNRWALGAASTSVEVGTGRVLSMSQNRTFDQNEDEDPTTTGVNYSTDKAFGGSSGFQTGSTYKIFVLADWLAEGFLLGDRVDARNRIWDAQEFSANCGGLGGTWEPKNSDGGVFTNVDVVTATASSINTAFVNMAAQLDLCDIRDLAMSMGVQRADGDELSYVPSSILGTNELSPLTMANAMATFANNGIYCSLIAIDKVIVRSTGLEMEVPKSECSRVISAEVAAAATHAFKAVISGGTATRSNTDDDTPIAGKTGSTDSYVQTWMTGYSTSVATATWVGNVVGKTSVTGTSVNGVNGGSVRHEIWRTIMERANELYPGEDFPGPPSMYLGSSAVTMPDVNALPPDVAEQLIRSAGLSAQVSDVTVASGNPIGTVASADFAAGSTVPRGTLVTISISRGGTVPVPDVAGLSVVDAKAKLLAAGFAAVSEPQSSQSQFFVNSSTVPVGNVVGTSPPAGTPAEVLGAILLVISKGP